MLSFSPWAFLPPTFSVFTAGGLLVVYFNAISDEKIVPLGAKNWRTNGTFYPPYISISGNFPPNSCLFSEVMNLAAFMGFVIGVLRYLQLKPRLDKQWLNFGSLVAFAIGCFGMTLVGNYQVFTDEVTHNVGTLSAFGLGTVFCWIQSFITLRANIRNEGKKAAILRFLLSGIITLCMVLHFGLASQSLHTEAAQFQWALVMSFLVFIGTFGIEFRHNRFGLVCTDNAGRPVSLTFTEMTRCEQEE